jgi:hypothetical protein
MSLNSLTKLLVIILLPLLFTAVSCNKPTEPPPPEKYDLEIIAADASCTEVWIDVKTPNTLLPQIFTLTENGEEKGSVTINKADTTIVIENLLPKQTYKYQLKNNEHKSNQTEITTLDTTSHNFTWQTFEFGQHSSSVLYDVAIIDENNIWAVGEIYMNDANGNPDPQAYNAVHWDGAKWELKRIMFYTFCPQGTGSGSYPARSVFAFDNENIVISSGSQITILKNGIQVKKECVSVSVNKIWGVSVNDFYIVGYGGGIAHWNGSSWKKIESGTTVTLNDVWGGSNRWIGDDMVLVAAGNKLGEGEKGVLRIQNNTVNRLPWPYSNRTRQSIWFDRKGYLYSCGSGVFRYTNSVWKHFSEFPVIYSNRIRGDAANDLIIGGDFGIVAHYDGMSWKIFDELKLLSGNYESVANKGNVVIAVGWDARRSHLAVGRR